jgi:hypothetical protein
LGERKVVIKKLVLIVMVVLAVRCSPKISSIQKESKKMEHKENVKKIVTTEIIVGSIFIFLIKTLAP